ncbi:MAG: hypothetical protein HZB38_14420 [Planctomycetes bacterium]|nr:hypothetical protein [Planctomycetota bacterium]
MIDADSRPGSAAKIYLGGNFAQPTATPDACWGGNEIDRIVSYLGNRNCGAPWSSDEERAAENTTEAGRGKKPSPREAEKLVVMRAYAMRDRLADIFTQGSASV